MTQRSDDSSTVAKEQVQVLNDSPLVPTQAQHDLTQLVRECGARIFCNGCGSVGGTVEPVEVSPGIILYKCQFCRAGVEKEIDEYVEYLCDRCGTWVDTIDTGLDKDGHLEFLCNTCREVEARST